MDASVERQKVRALRRNEGLLRAAQKGTVPLNFFTVEPESEPTAEPVLILHGLLGSSRNFASWAKELSSRLQRPRRIIVPDLRNHGESGHSRSMSYVSMAMDVIEVLEANDIKRCCVIGHSMGGKVAAALALMYPESIESVAILDIAPADYSKSIGKQSETWRDISRIIDCLHRLPLDQVKGRKDADELLAKDIADPLLRGFALTNLVPDGAEAWKWRVNIKSIKQNMGLVGGFDLGQGVQEPASLLGVSFPRDAFFVQGGNSRFIRSIHIPEISALFPKFTLQTIRGAGHWVHSEDPEATLNNVQQFLDRADPTPFPDDDDYY